MQSRRPLSLRHRDMAWPAACFAALLALMTAAVCLALALVWRWLAPPAQASLEVGLAAVAAGMLVGIVGTALAEWQRLRTDGGVRVAQWLGGEELAPDTEVHPMRQRLLNIVDEMALASGRPVPWVFVLPHETTVNALVAGWGPHDLSLCITQGALERLSRSELQGLVAHAFGRTQAQDLPATMHTLALVWGLSWLHTQGRRLQAASAPGAGRLPWRVTGAMLLALGWPGWLCARLLQVATSRQRAKDADDCAVQFTRHREGLGAALRKAWHDEQAHRQPMKHWAAPLVATLSLLDPTRRSWLSCHPPLPERIERMCGALLPPLADSSEPPHAAHPGPAATPLPRPEGIESAPSLLAISDLPDTEPPSAPHLSWSELDGTLYASTIGRAGAMAAPMPAPAHRSTSQPGPSAIVALAERQPSPAQRIAADREAWQRMQWRQGPGEQRLAVLALMMDPDNRREQRLWRMVSADVHDAGGIQADVLALLPVRRVPEFERLLDLVRDRDIQDRRKLVEQARDLLRADGRVSPRDRLWWLALRHRLGVAPHTHRQVRPMGGAATELPALDAEQQHHLCVLTAYLARLLPQDTVTMPLPAANEHWYAAVCHRFGIGHATTATERKPDADSLALALSGAQDMSWAVRPQVLKAWVEEAVNHSPRGMMTQATADALRLMATLLDAPMPPMLEAHFSQGV